MAKPMCNLIEFENVRQIPGEPRRRWFGSKDLELVIWCDESEDVAAFQLCYNNGRSEYAFTWNPECGFSHQVLEDGEQRAGKYKATPILGADAPASLKLIRERFSQVSAGLPVGFAKFVSEKLTENERAP